MNLTDFQKELLRRSCTVYPQGHGIVDGKFPPTEPTKCGCFIVCLQSVKPDKENPSAGEGFKWEEREFEALVIDGYLECDGSAYVFYMNGVHSGDPEPGDPINLVYLAKITDKGRAAIA